MELRYRCHRDFISTQDSDVDDETVDENSGYIVSNILQLFILSYSSTRIIRAAICIFQTQLCILYHKYARRKAFVTRRQT